MYVSHGCVVFAPTSGVNNGTCYSIQQRCAFNQTTCTVRMYLIRQVITGTNPDRVTEDKNRVNLHAITIDFTVRLATLNRSQ